MLARLMHRLREEFHGPMVIDMSCCVFVLYQEDELTHPSTAIRTPFSSVKFRSIRSITQTYGMATDGANIISDVTL